MEPREQTTTTPLKLYAAWYCPFAQRAWMALLHKGLDFEYIEVDPYRKSRWWLQVSRNLAKVPVIVNPAARETASITVVDSTRIVEYLEDLVPHTKPLYPSDPNAKAELRFWADHINKRVVPYMYRFLQAEQPGEYRDTSKAALLEGLEQLGNAMAQSGPFFGGTTLTAIDILLVPFAYRIDALLSHYRNFSLPTSGAVWSRYQRWYETLCSTAIFQGTLTDPENYRQHLIEFYLPYSLGQGQKDVTAID